jgi:hypothetical protein
MRKMESDNESYLKTDARIIAENETYVAIALRVKKTRILKNLPLLAALSDLAPRGAKARVQKASEGEMTNLL